MELSKLSQCEVFTILMSHLVTYLYCPGTFSLATCSFPPSLLSYIWGGPSGKWHIAILTPSFLACSLCLLTSVPISASFASVPLVNFTELIRCYLTRTCFDHSNLIRYDVMTSHLSSGSCHTRLGVPCVGCSLGLYSRMFQTAIVPERRVCAVPWLFQLSSGSFRNGKSYINLASTRPLTALAGLSV